MIFLHLFVSLEVETDIYINETIINLNLTARADVDLAANHIYLEVLML